MTGSDTARHQAEAISGLWGLREKRKLFCDDFLQFKHQEIYMKNAFFYFPGENFTVSQWSMIETSLRNVEHSSRFVWHRLGGYIENSMVHAAMRGIFLQGGSILIQIISRDYLAELRDLPDKEKFGLKLSTAVGVVSKLRRVKFLGEAFLDCPFACVALEAYSYDDCHSKYSGPVLRLNDDMLNVAHSSGGQADRVLLPIFPLDRDLSHRLLEVATRVRFGENSDVLTVNDTGMSFGADPDVIGRQGKGA